LAVGAGLAACSGLSSMAAFSDHQNTNLINQIGLLIASAYNQIPFMINQKQDLI